MEIKRYEQGMENEEIFCKVGSWLTNKNVHSELGTAITSQDNDMWYIALLDKIAVGFALTRVIKSTNAIHVRFVYSDLDTKKLLIERILKDAKEDKIKLVWTNDREKEKIWKEMKFSFTKRARGEFGRWEKKL